MKIVEHKCITDGTFYYKCVLNVYVYLTLLLIYYTVRKTILWPVDICLKQLIFSKSCLNKNKIGHF